jgi:hypothetical protein
MNEERKTEEIILVANKIKDACIRTAVESFENASLDGVCCEGAWECAINAIRNLNPLEIISREGFLKKDS